MGRVKWTLMSDDSTLRKYIGVVCGINVEKTAFKNGVIYSYLHNKIPSSFQFKEDNEEAEKCVIDYMAKNKHKILQA
jgi:hypothetical protein